MINPPNSLKKCQSILLFGLACAMTLPLAVGCQSSIPNAESQSSDDAASEPKVAKKSLAKPDTKDQIIFTKQIAPIFKAHCIKCHGVKEKAQLKMTTKEDFFRGANSGPIVIPGNAEKSGLYFQITPRIEHHGLFIPDPSLGPSPPIEPHRLSDKQVATIKAWINQGAHWPDGVEVK